MAPEAANPGKEFCPVHKIFERDITDIKTKQEGRPCQTHTEKISTLERSDNDQWVAINQLRKTVWGWAGAIALGGFGGSILGTLAIRYFVK